MIAVRYQVEEAKLPPGWTLEEYVSNHHYVRLKGPDGKSVTFPAQDLLRCECQGCLAVFFVQYNSGKMKCPHCIADVTAVWGQLQVGFVPENENEFPKR